MSYYDGTKLLSLKDQNGRDPELYLVTGNRTAGKTVWFNSYMVRSFLKGKGKFMILYRFNYELGECAEKFFKDIHNIYFHDHDMASEVRAKGIYHELFLDGRSCGYAVPLNGADNVKKYSHVFNDVERMVLDEFQSETGKYCSDEVKKLLSIHTSVARGKGKQVRRVPVYMMSNTVSILNPYYTALGISNRLRKDTKFLKGDGFVLEQCYNEAAANAQLDSGFNRAFSSSDYVLYSAQNVYLNDNYAFVQQPRGKGQYLCTVKYLGKHYSIWSYTNDGIVYVSDKADMSYPNKISLTTEDHNINYVMLKNNSFLILNFRDLFNKGCFRFKNLECKNMTLQLLSY